MTFERLAVVRVPFPFTDRNTTKNRPALVLSDAASFNTLGGAPLGHCDDHLCTLLVCGELGRLAV